MSLSVGNVTVSNGYKATYSTVGPGIFSGITTDVLSITGSATKTVRILRISIGGAQTTAGFANIQLVKRSTANTGGTPSSPLFGNVSYNSNNPAGTATIVAYQSAPTVGNLVGIIRAAKINFQTATPTGAAQNPYVWDFSARGQELILRGTSEVVAINTAGTSLVLTASSCWIEWTEE